MIVKIKPEELLFFQTMIHPVSSAEILFHDFDALGQWDREKFGRIRLYQYPMLSWDSLALDDPTKTPEENDQIRNNLAENYNTGGRLTGKSRISIILDAINGVFKRVFQWAVISSYDKLHVQEIFEALITCFENHKILKLLHVKPLRSPTYKMTFDNGILLESVNMNITGKNPGSQFFGKHIQRHWMEECSFVTKDVSSKMLMAQSEKGCINRYSGMCTFTKASPMGEIFFDLKNKSKIINLPSYVNPTWNEKKENDSIKEFGGIDSPGYQVQIEGKVIEGMDSVFDIVRVRETYITDKQGEGITVKAFEVNKDNFHRYREILVIERPVNAEGIGIYFDVGEGGAPSEYIIIAKINKMYRYIYRVTTFQLSPNEEEEFVDYTISILSPNILGLDHTSGIGKSLFSHLINKYPDNKNSLIPVDFNSNIEIGFKKDANGKFVIDKNSKHVLETVNTVDWSIQCLKDIFYNKKIECYEDIKFDTQMNNIISQRTKQGKLIYGCKGENHLFQAFQVFAICNWITEFQQIKPIKRKKPGLGSFGG
jgi:hypothetical protein